MELKDVLSKFPKRGCSFEIYEVMHQTYGEFCKMLDDKVTGSHPEGYYHTYWVVKFMFAFEPHDCPVCGERGGSYASRNHYEFKVPPQVIFAFFGVKSHHYLYETFKDLESAIFFLKKLLEVIKRFERGEA